MPSFACCSLLRSEFSRVSRSRPRQQGRTFKQPVLCSDAAWSALRSSGRNPKSLLEWSLWTFQPGAFRSLYAQILDALMKLQAPECPQPLVLCIDSLSVGHMLYVRAWDDASAYSSGCQVLVLAVCLACISLCPFSILPHLSSHLQPREACGPCHAQDLRCLQADQRAWLQFLLQLKGLAHLVQVRP